jgi:murein DD-endopeptidase MepM/ murein hydrolase activator NlpD
MQESKKKNKRFFQKLKDKYRLIITNEDTFEEKLSFRLSRLNVFVIGGSLVILLVIITTIIIAYTPLKEYIPGYSGIQKKDLYDLKIKTDSLEEALIQKEIYILNIRQIIMGEELLLTDTAKKEQKKIEKDDIRWFRSAEDSMLRKEVENIDKYSLVFDAKDIKQQKEHFLFFKPIDGVISNKFEPHKKHFGIDIVAAENTAIKSVMSGRVIFASRTIESGNTLIVQHQNGIISVYKHCASLLKKDGDYVSEKEVIAIIGNTGSLSFGTHLHFELWINAKAVDPELFIKF